MSKRKTERTTPQKVFPLIENFPTGGVERKMTQYLSTQELLALSSTSKTTQTLFQPAVTERKLQAVLSAVYMGKESLITKFMHSDPLLFFQKGTYIVPLLNQDETLSTEYEQTFYDITPLQLALYTGDWQIWDCIFPFVPQELLPEVLSDVRLLQRGGPDLVKISVDPRTVPFKRIEQFNYGLSVYSKQGGPRITLDLLYNPDGIIYFQDQFFYANKDTQEVRLLNPEVTQKDEVDFASLQLVLNQMVPDTSRRTANTEHSLIKRVFGITLERNGIDYELCDGKYKDTYDGCIRLMYEYRLYFEYIRYCHYYQYNRPDDRPFIQKWEDVKRTWKKSDELAVRILGGAQRIASPMIMHFYLDPNFSFFPTPSTDELLSTRLTRLNTFIGNNYTDPIQIQLYPQVIQKGLGVEYMIAKPKPDSFMGPHLPHITWGPRTSFYENEMLFIRQLMNATKIRQLELKQQLEQRLEQPPSNPHQSLGNRCIVS